MYIIAGLGNPGRQYEETRHNVGFMAIDEIAGENEIVMDYIKHKAICGKGTIGKEKVLLLKPETYMNNSGEAIRDAVKFYKIDPEKELIIIYDDINLDVGKLRIRSKGSAGGHNGIKSIIACLGTENFKRIRIGVGEKPAKMDLAAYVLSRFGKEDIIKIEDGVINASKAAKLITEDNINEAMNEYN